MLLTKTESWLIENCEEAALIVPPNFTDDRRYTKKTYAELMRQGQYQTTNLLRSFPSLKDSFLRSAFYYNEIIFPLKTSYSKFPPSNNDNKM